MLLLCSVDADLSLIFCFVFEDYLAIDLGKDSVITSETDIVAGVELSAALSNDDSSGADLFAAKFLDAQHLRLAVSAVSG